MLPTSSTQIIIDPSNPKSVTNIFTLLEKQGYKSEFKPIYSQEENIRYYSTLPMVCVHKPERTSNKTGKTKPAGTYVCVYNPVPLGEGNFGAVHPVLGMWKQVGDQWIYKTKTDPGKERVLKTNANIVGRQGDMEFSYKKEYTMGHLVPHMGIKYPPEKHGDNYFLLQRKIPGMDLEPLILSARQDPSRLSIIDKLKISISLLQNLPEQVHNLYGATETGGIKSQMIHRDIKPGNVIVTKNGLTHLIDYGLAKFADEIDDNAGTEGFIDPQLLYDAYSECEASDLYSTGWTISQLWDDTSLRGEEEMTESEVITRVPTDLFHKTDGLSSNEKEKLKQVIQKLVEFQPINRISRLDALEQFQHLLAERVKAEDKENHVFLDKKWTELSSKQLLQLLKSPYAYKWLNKNKDDSFIRSHLLEKIGPKVYQLSAGILQTLEQNKFRFRFHTITMVDIVLNKYNSKELDILIKLGAKFEYGLLNNWHKVETEYDKLPYWVEIARFIAKHTDNAAAVVSAIPKAIQFNTLYYHFYLLKEDAEVTQISNIQKIVQFLKNHELYSSYFKKIENLINNPLIAASAKALLNPDLQLSNPEQFEVKPEGLIATIEDLVSKIEQKNKEKLDFIKQLDDLRVWIEVAYAPHYPIEVLASVEALYNTEEDLISTTSMNLTIFRASLESLMELEVKSKDKAPVVQAVCAQLKWDEEIRKVIANARSNDFQQLNTMNTKFQYLFDTADTLLKPKRLLSATRIGLYTEILRKCHQSDINTHQLKVICYQEEILHAKLVNYPLTTELVYPLLKAKMIKVQADKQNDLVERVVYFCSDRYLDNVLSKTVNDFLTKAQNLCTPEQYNHHFNVLSHKLAHRLGQKDYDKQSHKELIQFIEDRGEKMTQRVGEPIQMSKLKFFAPAKEEPSFFGLSFLRHFF